MIRLHCVAGTLGALLLACSSIPSLGVELSAGGYHVVRVDGGAVKGLGDGTYGQLGTSPAGAPATVAGLSGITDVAAGGFSTLALKSDGTVWFLGEDTLQHTTPHGTPGPVSTPVQVPGLSGIDAIAAGHRHYLALDTDTGDLYAWGHNGSGQVGDGGLLDVETPVVVLTGVANMSAGDGFSLAVKSDQTVWAWGRNDHGQLGLGDTTDRLSPAQVPGVTTADAVAAGGRHALLLLTDGTVRATGDNEFGQLGLGTTNPANGFTAVPGLSGIQQVAAGYHHSATLDGADQVRVWGRNFEGQCGGGASSPVTLTSPQVLAGLTDTPTTITCGYHFTLVELADGSVAGTGSNSDGQLDGSSVADQDESQKILAPQVVPITPLPPDLSPPSPNPMSFASPPAPAGATSITMTATTASDPSAPVMYFFDCTTPGGSDSPWQSDPTYIDTGLTAGVSYTYQVKARDAVGNETAFSGPASAMTFFSPEIAIVNPSFEVDENTDAAGAFAAGERRDFVGSQLTGWISKSGTDTQVSVGWKDIPASELHPNPPVVGQESQALSLISGASVLNTTGTPWSSLAEGEELTLTLSLGMRAAIAGLNWNEGTFFGLTDGAANFTTIELADTVANSGLIANNPATGTQFGNGTFTDLGLTYTVQASDLTRNGNIGILIYSQGSGASGSANQSFFDNVRLVISPAPAPGFAQWVDDPAFGLAGGEQGFDQDPDGDNLANGLEAWFGTHPAEFSQGLSGLGTDGTVTTFSHPRNEVPVADVEGFYQWSPNLIDWYDGDGSDGPGGGLTVTMLPNSAGDTTTVTATASGPTERLFFRAGTLLVP